MNRAASVTFEDVHGLIRTIVYRFEERYGPYCEVQEMRAQANCIFMEAWHSYDENQSAFTTWLSNLIWYGLLDHRKRICKLPQQESGEDVVTSAQRTNDPARFNLAILLGDMTADARIIAGLVVDSPESFRKALLIDSKEPSPRSVRKGLRAYLKGIGWNVHRVNRGFQEIREAI